MRLGQRLVAALVAALAWAGAAAAVPLSLATDATWTVADANGMDIGPAQAVCLAPGVPASCPPGATAFGYPFPGWTADLSSIPNALWIWAPGVTGQTAPAAGATATFRAVFYLCGSPTGGTITAAADNGGVVSINGTPVFTITDRDVIQTTAVPASALARGLNVVEVTVTNAADPPSCPSGQFRCNPAGLVLGATFEDSLPAWPTCPGNGRAYQAGETERLDCQRPDQAGGRFRQCLCVGSVGFWGPVTDACMAPPPVTCPSPTTGARVPVGATETRDCMAPLSGRQTYRCEASGRFELIGGACAEPVTCPSPTTGARVPVGGVERVDCMAPRLGVQTRTCQANGQFSALAGECRLRVEMPGGLCRLPDRTEVATCPPGTSCGPRRSQPPRPDWCGPLEAARILALVFGGIPTPLPSDCAPVATETSDWFCDP